MSGYQIRRRFGQHKLGTKAYQIWEIQQGDKVCVVFQFGKFRTGMDSHSMGGTVNIIDVHSPAGAQKVAEKQQTVKTQRGYGPWDIDTCPFASAGDFHSTVKEAFGAMKGSEILEAVCTGIIRSTPDPEPDVENSNKGKAKAPAIKIEESAPEWGTW
jgi:hypothetical protein